MSDKATSKVFDRTDLLTKLDAAEQALHEMTTLRDVALRDFVTATDKWERAEVQVIDLKARIEKLRSALGFYGQEDNYNSFPWVPKSLDSVIERDEGEDAREALKADDAASK